MLIHSYRNKFKIKGEVWNTKSWKCFLCVWMDPRFLIVANTVGSLQFRWTSAESSDRNIGPTLTFGSTLFWGWVQHVPFYEDHSESFSIKLEAWCCRSTSRAFFNRRPRSKQGNPPTSTMFAVFNVWSVVLECIGGSRFFWFTAGGYKKCHRLKPWRRLR